MHRRVVRPFGASIPARRVLSLLLALGVVGMLYDASRRPATWRWLAAGQEGEVRVQAAAPAAEPIPETVVPGPNDLDPDEMTEFHRYEELLTNRAELRPREMLPYWQLMGWSRTQSFGELEKRADREPPFAQLWEQPEKYRGRPFRLRLHIRRVLEYDAPENPLGIKKSYEAWGWTDESKSFPYVLVFSDKPANLPVGADVTGEVVFVGYFLKVMTYTAFDARRGAPLMIGRIRSVNVTPRPHSGLLSPMEMWGLAILGVAMLSAAILWYMVVSRRSKPATVLPDQLGSFTVPDAGLAPVSDAIEITSQTPGTAHEMERPLPAEIFGDSAGGDARR
jgi:hypothetical protein